MQKKTKSFTIDGKRMVFDSVTFKGLFNDVRKKTGKTVLDLETEIGDKLNVTSNAVHNWRFGMNGPVDLDTIKQLSEQLGIKDYKLLLREDKTKENKEDKENEEMKITERQKDALKRIYDAVIDFLDRFYYTNGYNDLWFDYERPGVSSQAIENTLYEIAEEERHKVEVVLLKEYIELYKLPVYELLEEYVCDDLLEIFEGKLSYAYRFEAPLYGITTSQDYSKNLSRIQDIMEEWM